MDTFIVIMQKDRKTGLFEKELISLKILENDEYILNIYAAEGDNFKLVIYLNLTTKKDVSDWEYSAVYDYYEKDILRDLCISISEKEDEYNPTWEVIINYTDNEEELENILNKIIFIHKNELNQVFNIIKDKKGEYEDE